MRGALGRHDGRPVTNGHEMRFQGRRLRSVLVILVAALLFATVTACGSDELTGSWRAEGEKGGRQLIVESHDGSYRLAIPGASHWIILEREGDAHVMTLKPDDPAVEVPFQSERLIMRFDEDRKRLVLSGEWLDAGGNLVHSTETAFTKVSGNTDGPPWP